MDRIKTFLRTYAVLIGLTVSGLYVVGLVLIGSKVIPVDGIEVPARWNEWGDFFAGFLSPVAIGWFVWTLVVQREELAETRKEMKDARAVWTEQKDQQAKLAQATEEANELQRKALFFAQLPHLDEAIEDASEGLIGELINQSTLNHVKDIAHESRRFNKDKKPSMHLHITLDTNSNQIDSIINLIISTDHFTKFQSAYKLLYQQAKSLNLLPVIRSQQRECARFLGLEPDA